MRFSFFHLLLIFPAWCIAYLLAPFTQANLRVSWRHVEAQNDIYQIRLFTENSLCWNPDLEFDNFDSAAMWKEMGGNTDPWGSPYQLIERKERSGGFESTIHVYSLGNDRRSRSNGNDRDDINSWDDNSGLFYREQIAMHYRMKHLRRTLWLTPLVYLALLAGRRAIGLAWNKFGKSTDCC